MFDTITFVFIILLWPLCFFLIGMILLQGGAGDLSSAFGGGGQLDSTLGVGAGRKMSKVTGWMSFAFLVIVAVLAIPHGTVGSARGKATETIGGKAPEATIGNPAGEIPAVVVPAPGAEAPVDGAAVPTEAVQPPVDGVAPAVPAPTDAPAVVPAGEAAPAVEAPAAPAPAAEAEAAPAAPAVEAAPAAAEGAPAADAPAAEAEAEAAPTPVAPRSTITIDE